MSNVRFFSISHVGVPVVVTVTVSMGVRMRVILLLLAANAVARLLPMGVVVSMMRGMCMHPHDVHSPTLFFSEHLPSGFGRPDPRLLLRGAVQPLLPLVVLRSHEIEEESEERGHHGEEAGEGKLGPRERRQARVVERFGGIREHVDESRGQNDPGGKGLGPHEEVAVGAEEAAVFSDERNRDSGHASEENGGDGDEFENQCRRLVSALVQVSACAAGVGHRFPKVLEEGRFLYLGKSSGSRV